MELYELLASVVETFTRCRVVGTVGTAADLGDD
jgi:hypothetical protein